jgi:hypothetical protein
MAGDFPGHFLVREARKNVRPRSLQSQVCRNDAAEKFAACQEFSSLFSFTPYLPPY